MNQMVCSIPEIICEDIYLPTSPSGVRLHLRRKCLASNAAKGGSVIIFVHGATFGGVAAFDAALPGGSWLDFAATHGHDAYALDVRGYGLSAPAESGGNRVGKPYARTVEAIDDLRQAVDFVLERTGADRVDLVGWSWGTAICGGYAAKNQHKVKSLVMYGPLWVIRNLPGAGLLLTMAPTLWLPILGSLYSASLTSFRSVTLADTRKRWFRGLDERTAKALCPDDVLERWWQEAVGSDPVGASGSPPVVRAPNGVTADLIEYWAAGVPTYDPGSITAPVLAIVGEWDVDTPPSMAQELFGRLTAVPYKRLEVLGQGTHSMSLEVNRFDLYQRVQRFLQRASSAPNEFAQARRALKPPFNLA